MNVYSFNDVNRLKYLELYKISSISHYYINNKHFLQGIQPIKIHNHFKRKYGHSLRDIF